MTYGTKIRTLLLINIALCSYTVWWCTTNQRWDIFWIGIAWALFAIGVGSFAGWHRYWSHKSYETGSIRKNIMSWLGILGLTGAPIHVIAVHRIHHANSDKEHDPHCPTDTPWYKLLFGYYKTFNARPKMLRDVVRDRQLRFIQKHYFKIHTYGVIFCFAVHPVLAGILFSFPIVYCYIAGIGGNAILNHLWGSQDHRTKDHSTNNWLIALISLGEGWHNNHHAKPLRYTTQEKWWQFDPVGWWIKYVWATKLG